MHNTIRYRINDCSYCYGQIMKTQISFCYLMKINVCSGNLSEIPFFVYFFIVLLNKRCTDNTVTWTYFDRRFVRSLHGARQYSSFVNWKSLLLFILSFDVSKSLRVSEAISTFTSLRLYRDCWIKLKKKNRRKTQKKKWNTTKSFCVCSYWQKFLPLNVRTVQVNQFKRTLMQSSKHKIILFEWGWILCILAAFVFGRSACLRKIRVLWRKELK